MKRHHLYEIDLDRLTAFCTVCGYMEIVLQKKPLECLTQTHLCCQGTGDAGKAAAKIETGA
jgi:hypothetical protein